LRAQPGYAIKEFMFNLLVILLAVAYGASNADDGCVAKLTPKIVNNSSLSIAFILNENKTERVIDSLHKQYGPVFQDEDGNWFVADASLITEVAKNTADTGRTWSVLTKYLGEKSFFISQNHIPEENDSWHAAFKAIAAHLKPKSVEEQTATLKAAVVSALEAFMREADPKDIPLDEFSFHMAYSSAMRFLFGYVPTAREVKMVQKRADGAFGVGKFDNPKIMARMGSYLEEIAREIRNHGDFRAAPNSIYTSLKQVQLEKEKTDKTYNEQWLRDQIKTLVWASFETTQSTIGVLLWYASRYPEEAEKVRAAYLSRGEALPENVATIRAFINETLRLHPPVSHFPRIALREFKLGDYTVPEGATLHLNIYSAQRRNDVWGRDARLFRPGRLDARGCPMNETNMIIPFGAGPRRCIGQYVAVGELAYMLGEMLSRYQIKIETDGLGFPFLYDGGMRPQFWGTLKLKLREP